MTLFDLQPLTPAEAIRAKGRHPIHDRPLDPDPKHVCGNCHRSRMVWVEPDWRWVCGDLARCSSFDNPPRFGIAPDSSSYCDENCCTFSATQAIYDGLAADGYDPAPVWPSPFAIVEDMPACHRWADAELEQVIEALT